MKRWGTSLLVVLLACIPILLRRSKSPMLLQDTDTAVLLRTLEERSSPWVWFTGDWPLQNHFYRPISTLVFEWDHWLHGSNPAGFGLTNAVLCVLCVLALFWFVRELTDSPFVATFSAVLFALWTLDLATPLAKIAYYLAWLALVGGLILRRRSLVPVSALFVLLYTADELTGIRPLSSTMIGWIPSRTASVMTVFVLVSLAAYSRYERTSAARDPKPEPGPLDAPATKSTQVEPERSPTAWIWAVLSVLCLWLALGSYEQAVMVPAMLLGTALSLRFRRYRPRWGWQAAFWISLALYLVLRAQIVPTDLSGYQQQQLRTSNSGMLMAMSEYLFPALGSIPAFYSMLTVGALILLTSGPWILLTQFVMQVVTFIEARRQWVLALTGYALSAIAFLPMAWLKEFHHYHYLPMAMRTILVAALVLVAKELFAIAWSRPALQAPARPTPAPGSLPRP